jgi:hypothetical protein
MPFQIRALPRALFADLFALDDAALAARHIVRVTADRAPGFPCRVSLQDAAPGESLLLLNFCHLDVATPYRSSHAIYVREGAGAAHPAPGEVPEVLRRRLLSVRAFDAAGMMRDAEVVEGAALEAVIARMFAGSDSA